MLWGLWMRFDARRRYTEREVNEVLKAWHLFGDHCTLRRELVDTIRSVHAGRRRIPA